MDVKQYFYIAQKWAWLVILGVIVGTAGGYYLSSRETPVYSASTQMLFNRPASTVANDISYLSNQQLAQTYILLLKTQPVIQAASEKLGYPVSAGQFTAEIVRDTQLISLEVLDSDPVHAADIANILVKVLIEQNDRLQSNQFSTSEDSLRLQLSQVEEQIASLQTEIAQVSQESYASQKTTIESQIKQLEASILDVQKEITLIEPQDTNPLLPGIQPEPSPEQTAMLQEKELRLDQLQSSLKFYQEMYLNLVGAGETPSSSAVDTSRLDQMNNTLALYQQIYANLLASYEDVRLARLRTTPNVVQVEMAVPASGPISPRPLNSAIIGGLIGLLATAGLAVLVEFLDDTIKTPDDAARMFDQPVIGYIPQMKVKKEERHTVFVNEQPRSPVAEAFRTLRTNLAFSSVDKPIRTLLVTSASPSEGKTTMAVNLAAVMAQSGKRVLLVDADLRRPQIHKYFNIPNRVGLSDYFVHDKTVQSIMRKPTDAPLLVVTSGSLPPNPSELLTSEKMVKFLTEAQEHVDYIVLDSPPFLVSDASILSARVDAVLLIVRPGKTHGDSIKVILEQTRRVGAKVAGIVFNSIPRSRGYYYGGYRHYNNYYYPRYKGYDSYYTSESPVQERKNGKSNGKTSSHGPVERRSDTESNTGTSVN